ncbi:MAG: division/cell wall cluster transcriptional repressor MraZ [Eubacterium sp.]|nr:division/cell wall cluster transcriptional repressor MraZ [Eubacterium sp.]
MSFNGEFYNSIDAKNRMIVPSRFRGALGARCVIAKGEDKCLVIYPMDSWEAWMEKLARLPKSDPKARAYVRFVSGGASECEFDKQGRIIIPQTLKEYAGIEKDLFTVGTIDRIEVWAKERHDALDDFDPNEIADLVGYGI